MDRPPMETAMSTDIVMDIVLCHLKVGDLLNCRKVSKFWNKAASTVLRKRMTMMKKISTKKTLVELEKCIKQNLDFPFVGLGFAEPWKLNSAGTMKFFKNYGGRFTRLSLDTCSTTRLHGLVPFITHLPRLSILELGYPGSRLPREPLDSTAGPEDDRIINLPSLRTLRISCEMNEDFLRQVFTSASPSLQIECPNASYEILRALKSVGELQAVSVLNVHIRIESNSLRVDELLSTESPTLTKLDVNAGGCISLNGLMKLLISSQRTLKYLSLKGICPSHFSPKCPVLDKLTTLHLFIVQQSFKYVFEGIQGHKFPELKELKISTVNPTECLFDFEIRPLNYKLSDDLFVVPSLTRIDLGSFFDKDAIDALARSFPKVSDIRLKYDVHDFHRSTGHRDPTNLWSVGAFKCLEKLVIWNYTIQEPSCYQDQYTMTNMDSFLTGIPLSICENLRKQNQQNLKDSPFNEILRDSPNILQLKNLKELVICVKLESGLKKLPEEPPFISMVSFWYALEMMPNLVAKFVYEEQNEHKAVKRLKAAFKHVHPHVELEPFFD